MSIQFMKTNVLLPPEGKFETAVSPKESSASSDREQFENVSPSPSVEYTSDFESYEGTTASQHTDLSADQTRNEVSMEFGMAESNVQAAAHETEGIADREVLDGIDQKENKDNGHVATNTSMNRGESDAVNVDNESKGMPTNYQQNQNRTPITDSSDGLKEEGGKLILNLNREMESNFMAEASKPKADEKNSDIGLCLWSHSTQFTRSNNRQWCHQVE